MLKTFRGLLEGPGKYVFAVLLILAFSVVGVPALENFGSRAAVKVGSQEITSLQLEREILSQVRQIQIENPDVTREQALQAGIGQRAIETLVARALIDEEAKRLGLATPNEVLQLYIRQIDGLTDPETGRFDDQVLGLFLQQQGITVSTFREMVEGDMLRQQLTEALSTPTLYPEELVRPLILLQSMERDLRFTKISADAAAVEPTEDEITAAYQENLLDYMTPEYRTFTLVTVDEAEVAAAVEVSEDDIRQLYEVEVGVAAARETRDVRQLLVAGAAAEQAAAAAEAGGNLDALAEAAGGTINTLSDQARTSFLDEDVADAIFAAEAGALVGPVETDFGTVYAEVTEISGSEGATFEERREALEAELRAEIAREDLSALIEELENARDTGATLADAADALGLEVRTEGPVDANLFTRFDAIANIPPRLGVAGFRLAEGEESDAIRLDDGFGFVSVDRVEAPQPRAIEDVRDALIEGLKADARSNAAEEIEARFLGLIAGGESFETASAQLGGEIVSITLSATSDPSAVPAEVLAAIQDLSIGEQRAIPASGEPSVYVAEFTAARFMDRDSFVAALPVLAQQFGQQMGSELNNAYIESLEEVSTVTQNPRQVARALGTQDQ